jgi:hypothetical protein
VFLRLHALHLQTFLGEELRRLRSPGRIEIRTGLFGDLIGNIERLQAGEIDALAVVLEWGDLDSWLAVRNLGGWRLANLWTSKSRLRGLLPAFGKHWRKYRARSALWLRCQR